MLKKNIIMHFIARVKSIYIDGGLYFLIRHICRRFYRKAYIMIIPLVLKVKKNIITIGGVKLDITNLDLFTKQVFLLSSQNYEKDEGELIEKYLPSDIDVVDLGAGVGFTACKASKLIKNRQLIALEANENLIPIMKRNMSLNSCNYIIRNLAYSPDEEEVSLLMSFGGTFAASSVKNDLVTNPDKILKVNSTSLFSIIDANNFERFSLICDIEGMEVELLNTELELLVKK